MSFQGRTPRIIMRTPMDKAPTAGQVKLRLKLSREVLRHASSGPSAVSSNRNRATGMATLLPWTSSEILGNHVPHNTTKQATTNNRLLNRKLDLREMIDSSLCSLRR